MSVIFGTNNVESICPNHDFGHFCMVLFYWQGMTSYSRTVATSGWNHYRSNYVIVRCWCCEITGDVSIECRQLRSVRYLSDGFCTSVRPVHDVVCTGNCLPIRQLPWYAEFIKVRHATCSGSMDKWVLESHVVISSKDVSVGLSVNKVVEKLYKKLLYRPRLIKFSEAEGLATFAGS